MSEELIKIMQNIDKLINTIKTKSKEEIDAILKELNQNSIFTRYCSLSREENDYGEKRIDFKIKGDRTWFV